jgi:hypothetical protein
LDVSLTTKEINEVKNFNDLEIVSNEIIITDIV